VITLPLPAGSPSGFLLGLACSTSASCWAVGSTGTGPLMERWNGRTWSVMPSPKLGQANIERVSCLSGTDCWATGTLGAGTATAHWNGTSWSLMRTPTSGRRGDWLLGVSCHGAMCMAVGGRVLAQRWTGSAWVLTPTGTIAADPNGIACTSDSGCMAVGRSMAGGGSGFAERWTGSRWQVLPTPRPPGASPAGLAGVSCTTEHWNGLRWSISG
jgi:hypothetical protein